MKARALQTLAVLAAVGLAFGVGLYLGGAGGSGGGAHEHAAAGEAAAGLWTCSMHPQVQQPEPGLCPICAMELIPLQAGAGAMLPDHQVQLSPRAARQARVRTAAVVRAPLEAAALHLPGRLEVDETSLRVVTSWVEGRVERLHVATTGQVVRRGQIIATLYSPEVYTAHQELLVARRQVARLQQSGGQPFAIQAAEDGAAAVRQRLRLLGVPEGEISAMEGEAAPRRQIAIRATAGGTVLERQVVEGAWVKAGAPLYRVADLSRLWLQIDAWEQDLPRLALGQPVEVTLEALPGEALGGEVAFVDPVINPKTRTARVRVALANPDGRLKPGMFAEAVVQAPSSPHDPTAQPLVIPATAPLLTGRRAVVYVEVPGAETPTWEAREVRLGARQGEVYPVLEGLAEGERVVVEGAFRLDADLQIRGGQAMMMRGDDRDEAALLPLPTPARAVLGEVVLGYLRLQQALAADDLGGAQEAARGIVAQLRGMEALGAGATPEAREAWAARRGALLPQGEAVADAAELEAARRPFEPLSAEVERLVRTFGNPTGRALRVAFCPMAFDNRGAAWVQEDGPVLNAYFGPTMLRCGEVREALPEASPAAAPGPAAAQGSAEAQGHTKSIKIKSKNTNKKEQAPSTGPAAPSPATQPATQPTTQPTTQPASQPHVH